MKLKSKPTYPFIRSAALLMIISLLITSMPSCGSKKTQGEGGRIKIKSIEQHKNYLVCTLTGDNPAGYELSDLVERVNVLSTPSRLVMDGNNIYPCKGQEGRLLLAFTSGKPTLFQNTEFKVNFSLDAEKVHPKANCSGNQGTGESIINTQVEERDCPEPSDIIIDRNYEDCNFSVRLKEPFHQLAFKVLVKGEEVPKSNIKLKSMTTWDLIVLIEEPGCPMKNLYYYLNDDVVNVNRCPKEYDQKKVDEIDGLLNAWLKDPSNRSKMDKCEAVLTSTFGDNGYEIILNGDKLDTYAALREQVDNETLNDSKASYRLLSYQVDKRKYQLTTLKVMKNEN